MNGFIIVGLLGVIVLAVFLWLRGRKRRPGALPPPSEASLLDTLFDWSADERRIQRILVDNPQRLYGFALPAAQAQG